jgi:hypothetical protein
MFIFSYPFERGANLLKQQKFPARHDSADKTTPNEEALAEREPLQVVTANAFRLGKTKATCFCALLEEPTRKPVLQGGLRATSRLVTFLPRSLACFQSTS